MESPPLALDTDNLFTAARRVVRGLRIDDEHNGGLLSRETVQANDTLSKHVETWDQYLKTKGKSDAQPS